MLRSQCRHGLIQPLLWKLEWPLFTHAPGAPNNSPLEAKTFPIQPGKQKPALLRDQSTIERFDIRQLGVATEIAPLVATPEQQPGVQASLLL